MGQLGILAKDVATLLDGETRNGENDVTVKRAQLQRIAMVMGKVARIEVEEKNKELKKCNFYNRGFCKMGSACIFFHNDEVCESFEDLGICQVKRSSKRHQYACKFLNSEKGCMRGEFCDFSHRESATIERDKVVALSGTKMEELGMGKFGWVPKNKGSVVSSKASGLSCEQLISKELQGVHLLIDKEVEIDAKMFEEDRKVKEKDSEEDDVESDLYDQLVEAINVGNGELQEEMMDKILEGFDKVNNSKEEVNST